MIQKEFMFVNRLSHINVVVCRLRLMNNKNNYIHQFFTAESLMQKQYLPFWRFGLLSVQFRIYCVLSWWLQVVKWKWKWKWHSLRVNVGFDSCLSETNVNQLKWNQKEWPINLDDSIDLNEKIFLHPNSIEKLFKIYKCTIAQKIETTIQVS